MLKPVTFKICFEGETMSQLTVTFSVNVSSGPPPGPFTVVDAGGNPIADGQQIALPDIPANQQSSTTLFTVSGGTAPYNFSVSSGSVPGGMALNATTNADGSETVTMDGTPMAAGPNQFSVAVSDSAGAKKTVGHATKSQPVAVG